MNSVWAWGGFAAIGTILAAGWNYIKGLWSYVASFVIVTVDAHDAASWAVLSYLMHDFKRSPFGPRCYNGWRTYVRPRERFERVAAETLGPGSLIFWRDWKPLWLSRSSVTGNSDNDQTAVLARPIRLTFIRGTFDADTIVQNAVEALNARAQDEQVVRFYVRHIHGSAGKPMSMDRDGIAAKGDSGPAAESPDEDRTQMWMQRILRWTPDELGPPVHRDRTALDDLSLSQDALDLLTRVRRWRDGRDWFLSRGLPWKYGAMLYGPPGTGKTAFVRAIGEDLNMPVYSFHLASLFDDELVRHWGRMREVAPVIALIEDVDTVFHGREPVNEKISLTFGSLLNCIDGVERGSGLLVFVTTNKIETLDEALGGIADDKGRTRRPGRIDCSVFFDVLDMPGRQKMAKRILSDWPNRIADTVEAGDTDTGAQFERRCIDLAQELYYADPERPVCTCRIDGNHGVDATSCPVHSLDAMRRTPPVATGDGRVVKR